MAKSGFDMGDYDPNDPGATTKRSQSEGESESDWGFDDWGRADPNNQWGGPPKERTWAEDMNWSNEEDPQAQFQKQQAASDGRTKALDLGDLGLEQPGGDAEADRRSQGWEQNKRKETAGGWDEWGDWDSNKSAADDGWGNNGGGQAKQAADRYNEGGNNDGFGSSNLRSGRGGPGMYSTKSNDDGRGDREYGGGRAQGGWGDSGGGYGDDGWSSPSGGGGGGMGGGGMPSYGGGGGGDDSTQAIDVSNIGSLDAPSLGGGGMGGGAPQAMGGGGPQAMGGPALASLVIFAPNEQPVTFELRPGVTSVGRGLENNVVLSDPFASRKHLMIIHRDGNFEVKDSSSNQNTTVNGHLISHAGLRPGDHIEIGSTVMRFIMGPPDANAMMPGPPPPVEPYHLAPPPAGGGPGMAHPGGAPPKKKKTGLIIALLVLVLGGIGAAVFFIAGGDDKGGEATADDGKKKKKKKKSASTYDEEETASSSKSKGKSGEEDPEETPDEPPPSVDIDARISAAMLGGAAMSTGKVKPQDIELAPIPVWVRFEGKAGTSARLEVIAPDGERVGYTPFGRAIAKGKGKEKWTLRAEGYKDKVISVDRSKGYSGTVTLKKGSNKKKKKKRKKGRKKAKRSTSIPIVD